MSNISFGLKLGRSFDIISLKLDMLVSRMKNWSCVVFGPYPLKQGGGGEGVVSQVQEFWKMKV